MVIEFSRIGESLPLANVECQQCFVTVATGTLRNALKMFGEIFAEEEVELFAQKMCCRVLACTAAHEESETDLHDGCSSGLRHFAGCY